MENQIRALRKERGISQEDLARRCGVSRQTINAIENNKYDPTLSLAFRLARELGVTVDGLFTPGESQRTRLTAVSFFTVEKVAKPLFRERLHEILTSISGEIVGQNFVRGVLSAAHVLGKDGIEFYSAVCGRRNSLQEGFF